jgi:hypothetical protein
MDHIPDPYLAFFYSSGVSLSGCCLDSNSSADLRRLEHWRMLSPLFFFVLRITPLPILSILLLQVPFVYWKLSYLHLQPKPFFKIQIQMSWPSSLGCLKTFQSLLIYFKMYLLILLTNLYAQLSPYGLMILPSIQLFRLKSLELQMAWKSGDICSTVSALWLPVPSPFLKLSTGTRWR